MSQGSSNRLQFSVCKRVCSTEQNFRGVSLCSTEQARTQNPKSSHFNFPDWTHPAWRVTFATDFNGYIGIESKRQGQKVVSIKSCHNMLIHALAALTCMYSPGSTVADRFISARYSAVCESTLSSNRKVPLLIAKNKGCCNFGVIGRRRRR